MPLPFELPFQRRDILTYGRDTHAACLLNAGTAARRQRLHSDSSIFGTNHRLVAAPAGCGVLVAAEVVRMWALTLLISHCGGGADASSACPPATLMRDEGFLGFLCRLNASI